MNYFKILIPALFIFTGIQGQILFRETFDDNLTESRGWYDGTACRISDKAADGRGRIEFSTDSSWVNSDPEKDLPMA
ncbi:MAG: hypothetical protein IPJ37_24435 [Bacteroidales bacterium]|nr:hypothetical protein [Bacteroidales bacterium]